MRRMAVIVGVLGVLAVACSNNEPEFTVPEGASVGTVDLTLNGTVHAIHPNGDAVLAVDDDGRWCRVSLIDDEVACLEVELDAGNGAVWQPEGGGLLITEPELLRSVIVDFDTGDVDMRSITADVRTIWTSWTSTGSAIVGVELGDLDDGGTLVVTGDPDRTGAEDVARVPGDASTAAWAGAETVWVLGPDNVWAVGSEDGTVQPIIEDSGIEFIGTDTTGTVALFADGRARDLLHTKSAAMWVAGADGQHALGLMPPRPETGGAILRDAGLAGDGSVVAAVWFSLADQTVFLTAAPIDTTAGTVGEWVELHEWADAADAPDGLLAEAPLQWTEAGSIYAVSTSNDLIRIDLDF